MRTLSIFAGRIFGVEFRIHLSFLFLLLFLVLSQFSDTHTMGFARELGLVGLIFISVVFHEFGHLLVCARMGVPVRGIMLLPIGGTAFVEPHDFNERIKHPSREASIAIAGPLVNLLLAAASGIVLLRVLPHGALWNKPLINASSLPRSFFWINVFLFAFNLLPAFPLDGGRVLRAWMAGKTEVQQATRRAVSIGLLFSVTFMLIGAAVSSAWLMLFGLFIFMAGQLEERTVLFQSVVESVRMEDIMLTDFSTLSPADTLEDALHKAVHSLQDDFPVVRGLDLVGIINRQTIIDRLRREGNGYVQGAMSKVFEIAARSESLASAFRKLTGRGLTLIPVVDEERLVGIVTLQNLMHSMGLLAESRRLKKQLEEA